MFLSGVHHTKNKNLKLSNVVEDDEWKSGNRPVPQTVINRRTPIGICYQFERRGFHAFKEFHSQPYVGRTSSRQTLHPYEKGDDIEPGIHRLASWIFFQTSS
jgi:hypothetical protein